MTANEYMERLYNALLKYFDNAAKPIISLTGGVMEAKNVYEGEEGCLRLAREFGVGLKDYPEKERLEIAKSSYGYLCVRLYNLKPPVSNKEWIREIMKTWEKGSK